MTLERMDALFERLKWDDDALVSRDFVRAGMRAADLEALGTLYQFLSEGRGAAKIAPPLEPGELVSFVAAYLARCLREDPLQIDFVAQRSCTRQGAGWEFVRWYVRLAKALPPETESLATMRAALAVLYRDGDGGVRAAVAGNVLSHLFASGIVRRTFADWKNDPALAEAYAAALPAVSERTGMRVKRAARVAPPRPHSLRR